MEAIAAVNRIHQSIKELLLRRSLQTKLMVWSLILAAAMVACLYLVSQNMTRDFILQKQIDYDLNSFRQVGSYFKSYFENVDGNINRIYLNTAAVECFRKDYDPFDLQEINRRLDLLNREISNTFFQYIYIDSLIILGENKFSYIYTPFNSGRYASADFSYHVLVENLLSHEAEGIPFFNKKSGTEKASGLTEKHVLALVKEKIILVRSLRKPDGTPAMTMIATFNPRFIAEIFPDLSDTQAHYLVDRSNQVVWPGGNTSSDFPVGSPALSGPESNYTLVTQKGKEVLYTHSILRPYNFRLITSTPMDKVLKDTGRLSSYTISYGILYILFVLLASYAFSRRITAPLHSLAEKLSLDSLTSGVVQKESAILTSPGKHSLQAKLVLYFVITIIIPGLIFISLLFFSFYQTYRSKVVEFTTNTIGQVKQNIEYKLKSYEEITRDTVYSQPVQNLLNGIHGGSESSSVDKLFSNLKTARKDILSMKLFRKSRDLVYSSNSFDTASAEKADVGFYDLLDKSAGNLVFLGLRKDYYMNSTLVFARKIKSESPSNFSQDTGYAVFYIDPASLQKIYEEVRPADSGYFFMTDRSGTIFGYTNELVTEPMIKSEPRFSKLSKKDRQAFSIRYTGRDYLVIYEPTRLFELTVAGIIPYAEINSKLYPFIFYGFIFLFTYSALVLAVSSLIAFSITRPLKKLEKLMAEVTTGENLNVHMNYKGKDEIAVLSDQFNRMICRLNELIHENYQVRLRESELMFLEKEAQLNALQQQINPHFLYNTLDSIKWMAYKKGATEICDMTTALGKFFRGSIAKSKDFVTLSEEFDHLKNYLFIQELRYHGRFEVVWALDSSILTCKTAKLLLQPIVENAILHGLDSLEEGGRLTIKCYQSNGFNHIEITDNGMGMDEIRLSSLLADLKAENSDPDKKSIGLRNVYRRLKLYFDNRFRFEVSSREGLGTTVTLSLPIL